jgi:hypothetical protein
LTKLAQVCGFGLSLQDGLFPFNRSSSDATHQSSLRNFAPRQRIGSKALLSARLFSYTPDAAILTA